MFQSKAIKFEEEERSKFGEFKYKIYIWWLETAAADYYYDFVHKFITNPIFQIGRLYQWYVNVFRFDYDFDGHSLFAIIEYKLKRLEKVLIGGAAIQEDKDMRALSMAIKLAGRLKDDKYESVAFDRHDKKWGQMKQWFTPCKDGSGNSLWNSSRPKAKTPKQKKQERKEFLAAAYGAEAKAKREEKYLYDILHKYLRSWWD